MNNATSPNDELVTKAAQLWQCDTDTARARLALIASGVAGVAGPAAKPAGDSQVCASCGKAGGKLAFQPFGGQAWERCRHCGQRWSEEAQ